MRYAAGAGASENVPLVSARTDAPPDSAANAATADAATTNASPAEAAVDCRRCAADAGASGPANSAASADGTGRCPPTGAAGASRTRLTITWAGAHEPN